MSIINTELRAVDRRLPTAARSGRPHSPTFDDMRPRLSAATAPVPVDRTYVIALALPDAAALHPLGTVVASSWPAARWAATVRWPAGARWLVVLPACSAPADLLGRSLALDATAP